MAQIAMDSGEFGGGEDSGADEFIFKVPVVGASGVGKTVILRRIAPTYWTAPSSGGAVSAADLTDALCDTNPTLGVDFVSRLVVGVRPETNVRLQFWDVAGIQKYAASGDVVLRNAAAALLVYDVSDATTFGEATDKWFNALVGGGLQPAQIVLVGNKSDIRADISAVDDMMVTFLQGKKRAKQLGCEFVEVSARKNENCDQLVTVLCEQLMKRFYGGANGTPAQAVGQLAAPGAALGGNGGTQQAATSPPHPPQGALAAADSDADLSDVDFKEEAAEDEAPASDHDDAADSDAEQQRLDAMSAGRDRLREMRATVAPTRPFEVTAPRPANARSVLVSTPPEESDDDGNRNRDASDDDKNEDEDDKDDDVENDSDDSDKPSAKKASKKSAKATSAAAKKTPPKKSSDDDDDEDEDDNAKDSDDSDDRRRSDVPVHRRALGGRGDSSSANASRRNGSRRRKGGDDDDDDDRAFDRKKAGGCCSGGCAVS